MAQTQIKKLVGRIDNEYYVCDTLFKHEDNFKGATATVLCPVFRDDYENRLNYENPDTMDYFDETWRQAVQAGTTQKGLKAWIEEIFANHGDEAVFDFSGYDYWDTIRVIVPELTEEDYPVFKCIGGGHSFSPDMEWDEIYDEELWQRIKAIETQ